jgi:cell wall-associated NlpC family hydrolase
LPRNARLRAFLVAVSAIPFVAGVGPAIPAAAAATPTAAASPVATPTTTPPKVIATPTPVAAEPAPAATASEPSATPAKVPPAQGKTVVRTTRADQVIAIARSKLGHRWVYGAAGPAVFDCVGLVIYSFRTAGIASAVGTSRESSGFALLARFRAQGLATRSDGKPGDLVIWGGGAHVGIYLGKGMAISTLVTGVRVHAVRALTTPFTAFLHTGIATATAAPRPVKPKPSPSSALTVAGHRVTTTALRLRSGPSAASRVLATLAGRTKVGVVRVAKDSAGRTWYRVKVGSRVGWLAGWYTRAA